jgi:NAD(P)-dependent dehydrogenase (short-subunit alcohol dehydrogenase family)
MTDPTSAFRLDGRTALVTGVGPGIGAHVATAYATAGANVVLAARDGARITALATELTGRGLSVLAVPADVGREDDLGRLVTAAEAAFGAVDIVFNNAHANPAWTAQVGLAHGHARTSRPDKGPFDYTTADWQACLDINVLAPYRLAQAVVPGMKERGHGVLINVLSAAAFRPTLPVVPYGVTKSALHMLTRYLAKAAAPEVRVNALCPATISVDGEVWEGFRGNLATTPLGRPGRASEVVGTALYLASDASSFSTGQVVFVDGGRVNTA